MFGEGAEIEADMPLSTSQLQNGLARFDSKTKCHQEFLMDSAYVPTDRGVLPNRVKYFRPCMADACRNRVDAHTRAMVDDVTGSIVKLARSLPHGIKRVAASEILLSIELTVAVAGGGLATSCLGVGFLSAVSCASGPHRATFALQRVSPHDNPPQRTSPMFRGVQAWSSGHNEKLSWRRFDGAANTSPTVATAS